MNNKLTCLITFKFKRNGKPDYQLWNSIEPQVMDLVTRFCKRVLGVFRFTIFWKE